MKKIICFCLSLLALNASEKKLEIGLCVMATGRYNTYAERFIESCRQYFFKDHNVTYFVFADGEIQEADDVVKVYQKRLGWPYDTMMRFHTYEQHKELYEKLDYLFASDADMLFVAPVGEEMLGDLVGTQHPGFVSQRGSYETNPKSTACVRKNEGKIYFAGGFYGGKKESVIKLRQQTIRNVDRDLKRNFIAVWHDESHLNRYFIDHPPSVVLSPAYCYPESWNIPYPKKLLALDKNHESMRKL
jgi:histo-blood group ABO system transferase